MTTNKRKHERTIVVFVSIWQSVVWTMEDGRKEHKSISHARDWAALREADIVCRLSFIKGEFAPPPLVLATHNLPWTAGSRVIAPPAPAREESSCA